MIFLGWIPLIGWFIFLPVGLVLFIYGLVAHSDLERIALIRPPVVISQPGPSSPSIGKYCTNCGTLRLSEARFCSKCGYDSVKGGG